MDREIKFRAWDEKENHFWYFTLQEILERRMYYRGDWDERILRGKKTEYTGLKDKNGVEIYEGDILSMPSCWSWYVAFENEAFRRVPLNRVQRINWMHSVLEEHTKLSEWEIIGNIFEDGDLLDS